MNFMYVESSRTIWSCFVVIMLSVMSLVGNSFVVGIIYRSRRMFRLVNFCLCFLAINNLVGSATSLVSSIIVSICGFLRPIITTAGDVITTSSDVTSTPPCRDETVEKSSTECFDVVANVRLLLLMASSGSQFWILVCLVVRSNAVMVTSLKNNKKAVVLCITVLLLPYLLSVGLYFVSHSAVSYLFIVFWVVPTVCFIFMSFRRKTHKPNKFVNQSPASRNSILRRVRMSSQFFFTPRYRFRTWTSEAFYVVSIAVVCQTIFWSPFYLSLAASIFKSMSNSPTDESVLCITTSSLLSAVFLPIFFYGTSSNFREGCSKLTSKLRRREIPGSAEQSKKSSTHTICSLSTIGNNLPMQPRDPIAAHDPPHGILKTSRSQSEDVKTGHRRTRFSPNSHKRSISFNVGLRDHWQRKASFLDKLITDTELRKFRKVSPKVPHNEQRCIISSPATFRFNVQSEVETSPGPSHAERPYISFVLAKSMLVPYKQICTNNLTEKRALPEKEENENV